MNLKPVFYGKEFNIYQEGPELVALTNSTEVEYSRLNVETKKASHWYARHICDRIYAMYPKRTMSLKICCLGSAMGAIPFELLHAYPNCHITCVDIDPESILVLKKSLLKPFANRVRYVLGDAEQFVQKMKSKTYHVIINDLFSEFESPPFVHTREFVLKCLNSLKPSGVYFANTFSDASGGPHKTLLNSLDIPFLMTSEHQQNLSNVVYTSQRTSQS